MHVVPISFALANEFVRSHHRHHKTVIGHKFSIAAQHDQQIVGVAIVGRPVARMLDDGWTVEVNRLATNGCPNACSFLYGCAKRVARELGYRKIITYILYSEPGTSLKASGWIKVSESLGGSWSRQDRIRFDDAPICPKQRWEAVL